MLFQNSVAESPLGALRAKLSVGVAFVAGAFLLVSTASAAQLEVVAESSDFALNGVTVDVSGRIFVSMPQWTDQVSPSVAEVMVDGTILPYPGGVWNDFDLQAAKDRFVNVNAVHSDGAGSLWVVDYAAPQFGPVVKGAQKLVQIDLETNKVIRVYRFDETVLPDGAKLNDVRVDAEANVAYLSEFGVGAIIVLDLKTGEAFRALDQHYSTRAHPDVVASFLGQDFSPAPLQVNDIELSSDGETLYYQPTGGPVMWKIATKELRAPQSNSDLEAHVALAGKSTTIGGMTDAPNGDLLLGSVSDNAVWALDPATGEKTLLVQDDRLLWPDAMSVASDGYLYIPAPQLRSLARFNDGENRVRGAFSVYRIQLPAEYVLK